MNPAGFLVYLTDFSMRIRPQWWSELFYGTDDQWKARVVKNYPIADEHAGKSIDDLVAAYPLEVSAI